MDPESAQEITLYCAKLGLNLKGKVKEYDGEVEDVRVMSKEAAGKLLGYLLDEMAAKELI